MALRNVSNSFPAWTATVGTMIEAGFAVKLLCTEGCTAARRPDLVAIAAARGHDFSLRNRRFPCRWKPRCPGWIRVYYLSGVYRPLWDQPTTEAWIEQDNAERDRRWALRGEGMKRLGAFRDRFDVGIVEAESQLTTEDLDVILGWRIRT